MPKLRGVILVLISAVAFGLMPLFKSWSAAAHVSTAALLALRFAIGSLALWAIVLATGARIPRGWPLVALVLMGAGCYFGEAYCYFTAIDVGAPSGLVSLLLYTFPAMVAIGAWLFFREKLTPLVLSALVLALIGAGLTALPSLNLDRVGATPIKGVLLGAASAVIYAAYILMGSRLPKSIEAIPAAAIVTGAAAVSFAILAIVRGAHLPATAQGWGGVLALAFVSTVIGITALLAGIASVGPVRASTLSIVEPAVTVAIGSLVLHEHVGPLQIVGGALILIGAAIAANGAGK